MRPSLNTGQYINDTQMAGLQHQLGAVILKGQKHTSHAKRLQERKKT